MVKRVIKIVILFILSITVLIGGWNMYKMLEYNKQSYTTNIYDYISPYASEVININKRHGLDNIYIYDPSLEELTKLLGKDFPLPVVISKDENGKKVLIIKINNKQEGIIRKRIEKQVALPFPSKTREYKDSKITLYSLADNNFLVCTFYKGLFAVSNSYKLIENIIDSDHTNTFFSNPKYERTMIKIRDGASISIFIKSEKNMLAMEYATYNDTIKMEGYILENKESDSTNIDLRTIPYTFNFPDSLCIDRTEVSDENNPPILKVILNKMH